MSTRLFTFTRYLVLALLLLQGVVPVVGQAQGRLAPDAVFCGTQSETVTADVVIRSPLADETPAPEPHTEHCSLCYIHTPAQALDNTLFTVAAADSTLTNRLFSSITNHALQTQHLQRLAFTHAPPYFS